MSSSDHRNPFLQDTLPSALSSVAVEKAQSVPAEPARHSKRQPRILVVDDSNLDRRIIRDHLAPLCYEVIEARNGEEALDRINDGRPDLVLLDVEMPGMDGFEVCRRIREEHSDVFLPVLLVTARSDMQSKIAGFCEGANDYITKPIHPVELSIRVESMLRIKKLEATLAAAKFRVEIEKRKIERVIESMQDGVIIIDGQDGVILNPSAQMTLAARLDDPNCDYETLCRILTFNPRTFVEAQEDDTPMVREIEIGEDVYGAIVSALPFASEEVLPANENGDSSHPAKAEAVIVLRNITKEKALEKMRAEFVSYVSHELRTPLTSIRSAISLILSNKAGPIEGDVRKFIGIADRNSVRLGKLIDDILDLSRREAGKEEIKYERCRIEDPIDAVLMCLSSQAEEKKISIHRAIEPNLPLLYAESTGIEQVMTNLLGNALKFTGEGGTIKVSGSMVDSSPRETPDLGFDVKRYVMVNVEDTGVGIPPDQLSAVFDKFHVARHGRGIKGTGLGLAIAKKIIEAHGGAIWAESELKRGTRMSFVLPELSEENYYLFSLRLAIDRCKRSHDVLSVVLLRFEAGVGARREEGAALLDNAFEEVLSIIQQNRKTSGELVFPFRTRREIHIVLQGAPKSGAFRVLRSLERILTRDASQESKTRPQLRFGVASYPDDGISVPELESRLSKGTGRLRVLGNGDLQLDLDPFAEL